MIYKLKTIISNLRECVEKHDDWHKKLASDDYTLHLAIFQEPYLTFIMEGKKKIETRFSKRPCPPFNKVANGDVVLLKHSGGDIVGICEVEKVWFYHLDSDAFEVIKNRFGELICPVDEAFWYERLNKSVATLMKIKNVMPIHGVRIEKRDRRGWVIFKAEEECLPFVK